MLEACALSDTGKVRATNQDSFLIVPEMNLYVLADGMGGARGGERASRVAVDTVADAIARAPQRDAAALAEAVEEANRRVLDESTHDHRLEGMGTTLVAALETGPNEISIASVGDSRAWLMETGRLRVVTEDQTWVQEVGRPLGLDEASLRLHPMRHVLTMAVGVAATVRIGSYGVTIEPGALLMLSSDGLHGVVSRERMEEILKTTGIGLEAQCQQLISAANDAGSPDNVTVVLIRRAG